MFWVTFDFERKYIKKKWENGCFTVTLALLSQEATTICSILDADSSVYSETIVLKVPIRLSFQCLLLFLETEKLTKCT